MIREITIETKNNELKSITYKKKEISSEEFKKRETRNPIFYILSQILKIEKSSFHNKIIITIRKSYIDKLIERKDKTPAKIQIFRIDITYNFTSVKYKLDSLGNEIQKLKIKIHLSNKKLEYIGDYLFERRASYMNKDFSNDIFAKSKTPILLNKEHQPSTWDLHPIELRKIREKMDQKILKEVERRLNSDRRSCFRFKMGKQTIEIIKLNEKNDYIGIDGGRYHPTSLRGGDIKDLINKIKIFSREQQF